MNRGKMSGILAMALVLGLALSGCATTTVGMTDPALNGRWLSEDGEVEIRFNNGYVEFFFDERPVLRGTYTTSANTITISFTEVHGGFFSEILEDEGIPLDFPSSWLTRSQLLTILENEFEYMGFPTEDILDFIDYLSLMFDEFFTTETETYEVSGNILTMIFDGEAVTYTRVN